MTMLWHFCIDSAENRALYLCDGSMHEGEGLGNGRGRCGSVPSYDDGYGAGERTNHLGDGCGDGPGWGYGDDEGGGDGFGYGDIRGKGTSPGSWL